MHVIRATGPGLAGLTLGLQPRLSAGPLTFLLTGTAGGYWLYRRTAGTPALVPGFGGTSGLMFPGRRRVRPLLEGRTLRLLGSGTAQQWLSSIALGLAFN